MQNKMSPIYQNKSKYQNEHTQRIFVVFKYKIGLNKGLTSLGSKAI